MSKTSVLARVVVAGAATTSLLIASNAGATPPPVSNLVATPNSVSLTVGSGSQNVNAKLDSNCPNSLANGQSYSVVAGTYDGTVVTVSGGSGSFHCGDAGATFTFTPVACGTTTVPLEPIAGNNGSNPAGQQKKLAGTTVSVTVTDPNNPTCTGGGGGGGGGNRPAAPAVANAYLNASSAAYQKACKAHLGGTNNWRGIVISDIANWMPKPESVKDDLTQYPTADDWEDAVTAAVDSICGE